MDERPWGRFEQLASNEVCTVKMITVQPGQRLSLQQHRHRDELWTVLDDGFQVEVGALVWAAGADERIWIPRNTLHRLANLATTPGRVVEVAFGHFDEADIERLADAYGR